MTTVIAVVGGSGGVGASSFAAVLAATAGPSLLVDLDATGGGIDVVLGIEDTPGARWSGLRLAGGRLAQQDLLGGLPRWGPCAVLAADVPAVEPDDFAQVVDAAARGPDIPTVVVDLPRGSCAERAAALSRCDLVVMLARSDVPGLVAAHAAIAGLEGTPLGVVLRRGDIPPADAARLVSAPLLGTLDPLGGARAPLDPRRLPRDARRVAAGVLVGVRSAVAA